MVFSKGDVVCLENGDIGCIRDVPRFGGWLSIYIQDSEARDGVSIRWILSAEIVARLGHYFIGRSFTGSDGLSREAGIVECLRAAEKARKKSEDSSNDGDIKERKVA